MAMRIPESVQSIFEHLREAVSADPCLGKHLLPRRRGNYEGLLVFDIKCKKTRLSVTYDYLDREIIVFLSRRFALWNTAIPADMQNECLSELGIQSLSPYSEDKQMDAVRFIALLHQRLCAK